MKPSPLRPVLVVGDNWDGTADRIDPVRFKRLTRLNIVPDLDERLAEIQSDPAAYGYYLGIRQLVGEGHDPYIDDGFTSHDGRLRPSLADVVAIRVRTGQIAWRAKVEGHRRSRRTGRRLLVSASTARTLHVIDTGQGRIVGSFESGDQPHESNFSRDGNASIGSAFTPLDDPALDATKGTAGSRSSTPTPCRSASASRWARSSPRPAIRT